MIQNDARMTLLRKEGGLIDESFFWLKDLTRWYIDFIRGRVYLEFLEMIQILQV